ncbi:MAG: RidA family protein [Anaerolineae bacterium]|nr:RidA family protein [Anaerolineae bacterium]
MTKQVIQTDKAPAAVGPYSQAIIAGEFVFCAGQIALIPGTRTLAGAGIKEQATQVLKNLQAVLNAAGSSLDQAVKTTVFLRSMEDFAAMNEVYATFFGENPPARSTVQVAKLPMDALVEIECVALLSR